MYSDVDLYQAAIRYRDKPVIIQSHSYQKHVGILTFCNYEFLILKNSIQINEFESSQWQDQITMNNLEEGIPVGNEETLIKLHNIVSISCNDSDIVPLKSSPTLIEPPTIGSIYRFEIKLGYSLTQLVAPDDANLPKRIRSLRRELKDVIGFEISPLHLCDSPDLDPHDYQFLLDGTPVGSGTVYPERHLAISPSNSIDGLSGEKTMEPVFGLEAVWLDDDDQIQKAEAEDCTVVEAATVMITHLGEIIKQNRADLLSYDLVCNSLNELRSENQSLVDDHYQRPSERKILFQVLKDLAGDFVWIGCFPKIAEVVATSREQNQSLESLCDQVRCKIGRHIVRDFLDDHGKLKAIIFEPALEHELASSLPILFPHSLAALSELSKEAVEQIQLQQTPKDVAMLFGPKRRELQNLFKRIVPELRVISYDEVPKDVKLEVPHIIGKEAYESRRDEVAERNASDDSEGEEE